MKGIGRNLLYWGAILEKTALMMGVWVIGIVAFITFMSGENFMEEMGKQLPSYLIMVSIILAFVNAFNNQQIYFPLTVSLGSGRKMSFIAMQVMQHLVIAEYVAAFYIFFYFFDARIWNLLTGYLMGVAGLYFIWLAMANLIAAATMRFGKSIGMIVYIAVLIAIIGSVIIGMVSVGGSMDLIDLSGADLKILKAPWILLVGAVLDLSIITVFYAIVRKKNLQFM